MAFLPGHKVLSLEDGATIAYFILGEENVGRKRPLVLINGLSGRMGDWERLTLELQKNRPVLIFDHRGIGDSKYAASTNDEVLTIESMAHDTIALIVSLGWKEVDICGHSMGGVILQQILITPNLPFSLRHALLTATTTKAPTGDPEITEMAMAVNGGGPLTVQKKAEVARKTIEFNFDKVWVADKENEARFNQWVKRGAIGRPMSAIQKQGVALFSTDLRPHLPDIAKHNPSTKILILHGNLDRIIYPSEAKILRQLLPQATWLEAGNEVGKVPTLDFGHLWWEYFTVDVWVGVVEHFLNTESNYSRL